MRRSGPLRRLTPLGRTGPAGRRSGPLERRARLRPVSSKRAAENRQRRTALQGRFGPSPLCHAGARLDGIVRCDGFAVDGHEILTRGRGGSIVDPDNVLPVCRPCHTWITGHPAESERLGLVRHSWDGT